MITLLVVVCIGLLVALVIMIQMTYWPASSATKSHNYRPLNTADDDEDKMTSVKTEHIKLEDRTMDVETSGETSGFGRTQIV